MIDQMGMTWSETDQKIKVYSSRDENCTEYWSAQRLTSFIVVRRGVDWTQIKSGRFEGYIKTCSLARSDTYANELENPV